MSVIYGLENVGPDQQECAVAIGVFDGVHWGHRAILEQLIIGARERGLKSTVLTFDRHPSEVLVPNRSPQYISTIDQRVELIDAMGIDQIVVAEFTRELANLPREEFARILADILRARRVVVGSNFRFGRGREGDTRYLAQIAGNLGMDVIVVSSVIVDGGPASSTRVRALISRGDVSQAAKLLGRRFALRGTVVKGEKIGRTLGFPTANIQTAPRQLIPARGVYVVESTIDNTSYSGVCNIGRRPTFDGERDTIEVHLSDFEGDLYGRTLDVVFCRRLRDEMTFESPESLADQIRRDIERAGGACT